LARAIDDIVKARRKYLAELKDSGEEDKATSYTNAIDEWISIVDGRKALEKSRKDLQGTREGETKESLQWRDDSMRLWLDKTQLGRLAKKRKL
jgi:hypothetical protein